MSHGKHEVRGTAAVFVDSLRTGSAVLVDSRYLLTAAHVLERIENFRTVTADRVEVEFPGVRPDGDPARVWARTVPPRSGAGPVDAAVLDLGEQPPDWLPPPVALSPARRVPTRVSVFGFPLQDELTGVWRAFDTSGSTTIGTVQLDWAEQGGTLVGHSGSPVLDPHTATVVGVLVEGSEQGRFDRFITAARIADCWPDLYRPWLLSGPDAAGAEDHFHLRAHGQRSQARGGDLFRGRYTALAMVRDWLTAGDAPGLPLVVTGQPGAGKSAVIARAVVDLQTERVGPGVAFHARGATHTDLLAAIADLTGVDRAHSTRDLINALRGRYDGPWLVVVDALDEASTTSDRREIARLLTELAALPTLRVAVATRTLTAGPGESRYHVGGLLATLGVSSSDDPSLVDLDSDRFFEPAGVHDYAAALLTQSGADEPGPPGRAWARYRTDTDLCGRLASVMAARAGRNYLVAAMAADRLSTEPNVVDPDDPGFTSASIPSSVGEALDKYLDALEPRHRVRVRGLLTALAYARGAGIDDQMWLDFSTALGYHPGVEELDELHDSAAADYLLQTTPTDNGATATRLFHQALADELLQRRHRSDDEHALFNMLLPAPDTGWAQTGGYARTHACDHAAACNQLPTLLQDPQYLAVADLNLLFSLLPTDPDPSIAPNVAVLRQIAVAANPLPPSRRSRLLALTAARNGLSELHHHLAATCHDGIVPRWAHTLGTPHQILTGHTRAVAVGRAGDRDIIVSGADDRVRVWDAPSGQPISDLLGHTDEVTVVAVGRAGGRDIIVSGSDDRTVRVWDATTGQPIGDPITGHTWGVSGVAVGRAGDRDIIISTNGDRAVQVWDALAGQPIGDPITVTWRVNAVAVGRTGERDIIVTPIGDETVRIWDAVTGQPVGDPLVGHTDQAWAAAVGQAGDRDIIVTGSADGTVRVWDATTGRPIGDPLIGHTDTVWAAGVGRAGDRDIIVSASEDRTVRVWDATTGQSIGGPLIGHTWGVRAVAVGRAGDRDIIVSGSIDDTVRVWDATTGQPIGDPLTGHTGKVRAVAVGRAGDRDIIVTASDDRTVRVWDAVTGQAIGDPLGPTDGTTVAMGRAGDRDIIVTGSDDDTVRIWDVLSGQPIGDPLIGHTRWVNAVAVGRAGDRDIIVSGNGSADRTLRIWDALTGQPIGDPIEHAYDVFAVAIGHAGTRDIIVSGSTDDKMRIWDAVTGEPIGDPLVGHTGAVWAVAMGRAGDRDIIVSGSDDHTVRIWDAAGILANVVDLLVSVSAVALSSDGVLYVAAGLSTCAFDVS